MKSKKNIYTFSCQNMNMCQMLFKILKSQNTQKCIFCVFKIAGYWEEVLITDICCIKTTSRKRKRWIWSLPEQKSLIISITHSSFFQQVISLMLQPFFHQNYPRRQILQRRDSLIYGDPCTTKSFTLQN